MLPGEEAVASRQKLESYLHRSAPLQSHSGQGQQGKGQALSSQSGESLHMLPSPNHLRLLRSLHPMITAWITLSTPSFALVAPRKM